jgi:hypothetical protein
MARKALFNIEEADIGRPAFQQPTPPVPPAGEGPPPEPTRTTPVQRAPRRQEYREGKRAVMFFLNEDAFTEMHVLLARQGRKKVQQLMEELVDDWMRREGAPRLVK